VIPKTQKSKRKYNGIVSFDNLLIYPPGGEIQETPTEWKFLLSDSSNGKDSPVIGLHIWLDGSPCNGSHERAENGQCPYRQRVLKRKT
jgi:hypothetical protein